MTRARCATLACISGPRATCAPCTARSTCSTWTCPTARASASRATVEPGDEPVVDRRRASASSACRSATTCAFPSSIARWSIGGAIALTVPAAFTLHDRQGPLARAVARARDRGAVLRRRRGADRAPLGNRASYGHALVCDPWGTMLAECGEGEGFAIAAINRAVVERVRASVPSLKHRRIG